MNEKIAFISDIHSNLEALKSVINDIEEKGIKFENVFCVGDLIGYGSNPNEVIEIIKDRGIKCILGNNDKNIAFYEVRDKRLRFNENKISNSFKWTLDNLSEGSKVFLRSLKEDMSLDILNHKILLVHGSPFSISEYVYENDFVLQEEIAESVSEEIIVFGHTHIPFSEIVNNKILINAGSVGKPKDGDKRACYSILELNQNISGCKVEFKRVEYDIKSMLEKLEAEELLRGYAKDYV